MQKITAESIRPFIRCVGRGQGIFQNAPHKAYDHRFIAILNGGGSIEINGENTETSDKMAFLIPPGTEYRVAGEKEQQILVVNFDWTFADSSKDGVIPSVKSSSFNEGDIIGKADFSSLFPTEKEFCTFALSKEAEALLDGLYLLFLTDKSDKKYKNLSLSANFLHLLINALPKGKARTKEQKTAEKIYSYVLSKIEAPLTLNDVAEHFHYSTSYVEKLLRQSFGTSFKGACLPLRNI